MLCWKIFSALTFCWKHLLGLKAISLCFQQHPQNPMNVNALKTMLNPYIWVKTLNVIKWIFLVDKKISCFISCIRQQFWSWCRTSKNTCEPIWFFKFLICKPCRKTWLTSCMWFLPYLNPPWVRDVPIKWSAFNILLFSIWCMGSIRCHLQHGDVVCHFVTGLQSVLRKTLFQQKWQ